MVASTASRACRPPDGPGCGRVSGNLVHHQLPSAETCSSPAQPHGLRGLLECSGHDLGVAAQSGPTECAWPPQWRTAENASRHALGCRCPALYSTDGTMPGLPRARLVDPARAPASVRWRRTPITAIIPNCLMLYRGGQPRVLARRIRASSAVPVRASWSDTPSPVRALALSRSAAARVELFGRLNGQAQPAARGAKVQDRRSRAPCWQHPGQRVNHPTGRTDGVGARLQQLPWASGAAGLANSPASAGSVCRP